MSTLAASLLSGQKQQPDSEHSDTEHQPTPGHHLEPESDQLTCHNRPSDSASRKQLKPEAAKQARDANNLTRTKLRPTRFCSGTQSYAPAMIQQQGAATAAAAAASSAGNETKSSANKALDTNHQHKQATSNKLIDSQQMHVCRLCDKLLSSSSSLDRHMLTHSGERPFVCKRCHMTFTTNGNMHRHMRTHLHKDSLARQQQEQQLKSIVGASVSTTSSTRSTAIPVSYSLASIDPAGASTVSSNRPFSLRHQPSETQAATVITSSSALLNQQMAKAFKHQNQVIRGPKRHSSNDLLTTTTADLVVPNSITADSHLSPSLPAPITAESQAAKYLRHQQLALMLGALQGDQLGLESVKAVMLAAAAAAAAVSQQQQHQPTASSQQLQQLFPADDLPEPHQGHPEDEEAFSGSSTSPLEQICGKKRRKQINPRSSRVHQATASLNSNDRDDDQLASSSDEDDQHHSHGRVQSMRLNPANKGEYFINSDSNSPLRHRPSSSNNLSGSQFGEEEAQNVTDEDDEEQPEFNIDRAGHSSVKRDVEDFNNNQAEEQTKMVTNNNCNLSSQDDEFMNQEKLDQDISLTSDEEEGTSDKNSINQMPLTPFALSHSTDIAEMDHQDQQVDNSFLAKPVSTIQSGNNSQAKMLTTVNGEVIEDISQSYVKTANPNAARKGGKRNRHCYKCKLCTYSSVDRCTLVRHLRIHSGERPYICGICRYAFTTKANCERHVRKRHKKQYNSLGGAGGGGVKGSNGGGRSLIITDHTNHQTIPVKVNPVAAQTISQTLQRIQEKQQHSVNHQEDNNIVEVDNIEKIFQNHHLLQQQQQQQQHQHSQQNQPQNHYTANNNNNIFRRNPFSSLELAAQALDLSCKFQKTSK